MKKGKVSEALKAENKGLASWRFWLIVWGMGIAGQLCWNMENQWFNTFVYSKIAKNVDIVTSMVICSAFVTTISTFLFGTLSDRQGKRKKFVSWGYIIWGITTIIFGMTEFLGTIAKTQLALAGFLVVLTDCVMSFFGSMGNDCGYNAWLNDFTTEKNKGAVGGALAALPVFGTVVGTLIGGALIEIGNETGDHADDNYMLLFCVMGGFVILMGIISLFLMKDANDLEPHKEGTFGQHMFAAFNFKKLKNNPNNKEMWLACLVVCVFFIPFNFYFTHLGNWMEFDLKFSAGDLGLIEGIALLFAVVFTIPFSKLINKNKTPLMVAIAVVLNAIGLFLIYFLVKDETSVDNTTAFAVKNIPLFVCVFLVGLGYIMIMQSCMVWVRGLFPKESRGQFEGVRVLFFVLIPMLIGTLIGDIIISNTDGGVSTNEYGIVEQIPQENMFLYAGILVLFTIIPLIFAAREYKKRIKGGISYDDEGNVIQPVAEGVATPLTEGAHVEADVTSADSEESKK